MKNLIYKSEKKGELYAWKKGSLEAWQLEFSSRFFLSTPLLPKAMGVHLRNPVKECERPNIVMVFI